MAKLYSELYDVSLDATAYRILNRRYEVSPIFIVNSVKIISNYIFLFIS